MSGRHIALVVLVGLVTGVVTQIGQGVLPDGWSQAANAISPWLAVAFAVGATTPDRRWAVVAGVVALLMALVGYYAATSVRFGIGGGTSSLIFWGIGALAGGVIFGPAGHAWRSGPASQRAAAIGLLAAAAIAEGVYQAGIREDRSVGVGFVVAGALVPLLVGRSWGDRARGYVATIPALALGLIGFQAAIGLAGLIPSLVPG